MKHANEIRWTGYLFTAIVAFALGLTLPAFSTDRPTSRRLSTRPVPLQQQLNRISQRAEEARAIALRAEQKANQALANANNAMSMADQALSEAREAKELARR